MEQAIAFIMTPTGREEHDCPHGMVGRIIPAGDSLKKGTYRIEKYITDEPSKEAFAYFLLQKFSESWGGIHIEIGDACIRSAISVHDANYEAYIAKVQLAEPYIQRDGCWMHKLLRTLPMNHSYAPKYLKMCSEKVTPDYEEY